MFAVGRKPRTPTRQNPKHQPNTTDTTDTSRQFTVFRTPHGPHDVYAVVCEDAKRPPYTNGRGLLTEALSLHCGCEGIESQYGDFDKEYVQGCSSERPRVQKNYTRQYGRDIMCCAQTGTGNTTGGMDIPFEGSANRMRSFMVKTIRCLIVDPQLTRNPSSTPPIIP